MEVSRLLARRGSLFGIGAATLVFALAAAQVVFADEPPGPKPDISSTHTYKDGKVTICVKPNRNPAGGAIYDVEFVGPWVPGINQPKGDFSGPKGWDWESIPTGGWRVFSKVAMALDKEYCFTFPYLAEQEIQHDHPIPPRNALDLQATDDTHHAIANFVSTLAVPDGKEAGVKKRFELPQADTADLFFKSNGECGVRDFEALFSFTARVGGSLVLTQMPSGQPISGRLYATGLFRAADATHQAFGGIDGTHVLLAYQEVLSAGAGDGARAAQATCTATFVGQGTLAKPGVEFRRAACKQPSILAPHSVRVNGGKAVFAVGLSCAGDLLSGESVEVSVVRGSAHQRVGMFITKGRLQTLKLGNLRARHWDSVVLQSQRHDVFRGSKKATVALQY